MDAYPQFQTDQFQVVPEVVGTQLDNEKFHKKVAEAINGFQKEIDLLKADCYILPKFTKESPEVAAACETMNGYLGASVDVYKRQVYQRDRDRILHSKAFRRLRQKTQVFLLAKGDHYRTRLTHTLEVSQNARTIAKALRLNEDLVEAIALGHDLGPVSYTHLYCHKKMKTNEENSLEVLQEVLPLLEQQEDFSNDALFEVLKGYVDEKGVKTGFVM